MAESFVGKTFGAIKGAWNRYEAGLAAKEKAKWDAAAAEFEGERQRKQRAWEQEQEELREGEKHKFFHFFNFRGTVYAAKKYQKQSGNHVSPVTEFFLQRPQGDQEIKLVGYDLSIANGHEIVMIYASPWFTKTGQPVCYINLNMRSATTLSGAIDQLTKAAREATDIRMPDPSRRLLKELEAYRKTI